MANRSGASATQSYRHRVSLGSGTAAATTGGCRQFVRLGHEPRRSNPSIWQQALTFFGGSLTLDEVADLYGAFAYYLDAIGAI